MSKTKPRIARMISSGDILLIFVKIAIGSLKSVKATNMVSLW